MKKSAQTIERRASRGLGVVKERIRMCGRPAVPNISAIPTEIAEIGSLIRPPGDISASCFGWISTALANSASGLKPKANITAPAKANAMRLLNSKLLRSNHNGIHSEKRAIAKAANNTIAPCAKLNTPEALKINTNPKATKEYNIPAIRPPSRVSKKNAILLSFTYQCEVPK